MAANGDKAPASTNGRQDAGQAVQLDARLLFVAQVMIGHTVTAQVIARAAPDGELHPPRARHRERARTSNRPATHAALPPPPQTRSGVEYEGVFHTMSTDGGRPSIVLRMALVVRDPARPADAPSARPEKEVVIAAEDLVQCIARDLRTGEADVGPLGAGDDAGGFGTDAAISRGRGG